MSWISTATPPPSTGRNALWLYCRGLILEGGYSGVKFVRHDGDEAEGATHWQRIGPGGKPPTSRPLRKWQPMRQMYFGF